PEYIGDWTGSKIALTASSAVSTSWDRRSRADGKHQDRRPADRGPGLIQRHAGGGSRRRREPALLLPRATVRRRQLPHVPGRGEGWAAEAAGQLRHGREGSAPGAERRAAGGVHQYADGQEGPRRGDGVPAHQPPARLPDLRPGRRV